MHKRNMSNDPNMKKAKKGEKIVKEYFEKMNYIVEDVSSTTGNNWDLIATHKDTKEKIKIEVCQG